MAVATGFSPRGVSCFVTLLALPVAGFLAWFACRYVGFVGLKEAERDRYKEMTTEQIEGELRAVRRHRDSCRSRLRSLTSRRSDLAAAGTASRKELSRIDARIADVRNDLRGTYLEELRLEGPPVAVIVAIAALLLVGVWGVTYMAARRGPN